MNVSNNGVTYWFNTFVIMIRVSLLLLLLINLSLSLILEAGQRIPPRNYNNNRIHQHTTTDTSSSSSSSSANNDVVVTNSNSDSKRSLLDLSAVEEWATERKNLKERHLKTLYKILMNNRDDNELTIQDKLINSSSFPKNDAIDLFNKFCICTSKIIKVHPSSSGGKKFVIELCNNSNDNNTNNSNNNNQRNRIVETVLIRHNTRQGTRYTICVSSQVGCARSCTFCATGTMGLISQLYSYEILEQVWLIQNTLNEERNKLRNVVFMGMGEPLDNWSEVHEACRGLTHQCLFGFGCKQITISTVGAVPERIRNMADDAPQVCLAISLHGATQTLRELLMPSTATRTTINELGNAIDYFSIKSGIGVMIEYLLLANINDTDEACNALIQFCIQRYKPTYVNLIPYNPTIAGVQYKYETPTDDNIQKFNDRLRLAGIKSHVRWTSAKTRDSEGACGQLVLAVEKNYEEIEKVIVKKKKKLCESSTTQQVPYVL